MDSWIYLGIYILVMALVAGGVWKVRDKRPYADVLIGVTFAGILVFLLDLAVFPHFLLPWWGWTPIAPPFYFHWPGWFIVAFFLLAAPRIDDDRSAKGVTGLALALAVFVPIHLFFHLGETVHPDLNGMTDGGFCQQTSQYSCGPTSLANLLYLYNVEVGEREMAELAWTRSGRTGGTNPGGLYRALSSRAPQGYQAVAARLALCEIPRLDRPVVANIRLSNGIIHTILIEKFDGEKYVVVDPLLGVRKRNSAGFLEKRWLSLVFYLELL